MVIRWFWRRVILTQITSTIINNIFNFVHQASISLLISKTLGCNIQFRFFKPTIIIAYLALYSLEGNNIITSLIRKYSILLLLIRKYGLNLGFWFLLINRWIYRAIFTRSPPPDNSFLLRSLISCHIFIPAFIWNKFMETCFVWRLYAFGPLLQVVLILRSFTVRD